MDKKIVDYRSVQLSWLISFQQKVVAGELAAEVELVIATKDHAGPKGFNLAKGETLRVLDRTKAEVQLSRPYGDMRTGTVPVGVVKTKEREAWSTEDVCEYVIKQSCMKKRCVYLDIMPKGTVSKREYLGAFVSQARRCRFADLVEALHYFFSAKKVEFSKQFVWLDIFCANQPMLTAENIADDVRKKNEGTLTTGLHLAIANFEDRVMFMDTWDSPTALTRAWCIWEVLGVANANQQIEIALSEKEHDRFIHILTSDYDKILENMVRLDVRNAGCHSKKDLKMIHSAVQKDSSFEELNNIVLSQLRLWVAGTGMQEMKKEEAKPQKDEEKVALLANQVGMTYRDQGKYDVAERLLKKALKMRRALSTEKYDEKVAVQLLNLAHLYSRLRKFDLGIPMFEECLKIREEVFGPTHDKTAVALTGLGGVLYLVGKLEEAKPYHERSIAIGLKSDDPNKVPLAKAKRELAKVLRDQGDYERAEQLFNEALDIFEKSLGELHPTCANLLYNLSHSLSAHGDYAGAEHRLRQAMEIRRNALGDDHPSYAKDMHELGSVLLVMGKNLEEARHLGSQALQIAEAQLGKDHAVTRMYRKKWG